MSERATLVRLGLRIAVAGGAAALALAVGTTRDAVARIGLYADATAAAEKLGLVVGGIAGPVFARNGSAVDVTGVGALTAASVSAGAVSATSLTSSSTAPVIRLYESDAGADQKYSGLYANGATLALRLWDDAYASANPVFTVARTGYVPGVMSVYAAGTYFYRDEAVLSTAIRVYNNNAGGASAAGGVNVQAYTHDGSAVTACAGFGATHNAWTYGGYQANAAFLFGQRAGGLTLLASHASGGFRIITGGESAANIRLSIDSAGAVAVGNGLSVAGATSDTSTVSNNALAITNGGIGSLRGFHVVSTDTDISSYSINFGSSRIKDTRATNGTRYQRSADYQIWPAVNTGVTDSGYHIAFLFDMGRNYGASNQAADNGTLGSMVGINVTVGHYNSAALTPQTTTAAAGSFTLRAQSGLIGTATGLGVSISAASNSNITTCYGINLSGAAAATASYGLYVGNVTCSTAGANYAIYTNTGLVRIGDTAAATSTATGALTVAGGIGIGGTSYFGSHIYTVFTTAGGAYISLQNTGNSTSSATFFEAKNDTGAGCAGYFGTRASGFTTTLMGYQGNCIDFFGAGASALAVRYGSIVNAVPVVFGVGGTAVANFIGSTLSTGYHAILYTADATTIADAGCRLSGGLSVAKSAVIGGSAGNSLNIANATGALKINGTQVVGPRRTGWTAQTATASRADLGASPTVAALASFCRALYDDLAAHGLVAA